jgi:hypothetical protein
MKKSFCLVAVCCLLGNVAYAFDVTAIAGIIDRSVVSTKSQPAYQKILDDMITPTDAGAVTKTLKLIRSISDIRADQAILFGRTDPEAPSTLKSLKDEEKSYNRKAASFAGFQRALAYVYRHKIPPDNVIAAFVEEFYE